MNIEIKILGSKKILYSFRVRALKFFLKYFKIVLSEREITVLYGGIISFCLTLILVEIWA